MTPPPDAVTLLQAIPVGTGYGTAGGHRWVVTRTVFNGGRSTKLVAEELGGKDYISANFYDLRTGTRMYPCEMPATKVIAFLRDFVGDGQAARAPNRPTEQQTPKP